MQELPANRPAALGRRWFDTCWHRVDKENFTSGAEIGFVDVDRSVCIDGFFGTR
jgi:hypothetical protein